MWYQFPYAYHINILIDNHIKYDIKTAKYKIQIHVMIKDTSNVQSTIKNHIAETTMNYINTLSTEA